LSNPGAPRPKPTDPPGPNLYERLADIAGSLQVAKNGHMTEGGKYDYIKHEDLVGALKPILKEHGIVILPLQSEIIEATEFRRANGGLGRHIRIKVTYRVVDVLTGVSIELQGLGESADTGDKGTQKAVTSAEKYLYMRLFKVVEDAMDTDGIQAPEGVKDAPAGAQNGSTPIPQGNGVNSNELDKLIAISATMPTPWATPVLKARLERFGFDKTKAELIEKGATATGEIVPPPPPAAIPPPPAPEAAAA
jgi:hypothetical protein